MQEPFIQHLEASLATPRKASPGTLYPAPGNRKDLEEEREKIVKGLEEVYRRLVLYKIEKKSPFVISRNGRVIEVDPNEMPPTTRYKRALK